MELLLLSSSSSPKSVLWTGCDSPKIQNKKIKNPKCKILQEKPCSEPPPFQVLLERTALLTREFSSCCFASLPLEFSEEKGARAAKNPRRDLGPQMSLFTLRKVGALRVSGLWLSALPALAQSTEGQMRVPGICFGPKLGF